MCITSPSDIRVIKLNTPIYCNFCIVQQLCIIQCVTIGSVDFRAHKKAQEFADQSPVLYMKLFTLSIHSLLLVFDITIHVRT